MRVLSAVVMVSLLAPLSGCLAVAGVGADDPAPDWRRLAQGQRATVDEPQVVVVTDDTAWAAAWALTGRVAPPPDVDFEKERVVLVFVGTRPHGGWSVAVTDVTRNADGDLVVASTTFTPHPDGLYTMALVHPYDVVAVPADGSAIVIEEREQVAPAPGDM